MFLTNGSSVDKSTETLGFGHCLHLSSSGLLATPRLTGKGNAEPSGASVRFLSLSPPALAIDAVKSTLWSRHTFPVPTSLCQPFPSLFCPPSLLPGLLEAGLPARPPGFLSPEASPNLGCYKEIPWMHWRPSAPGQQDSPLLRAAGICWTRGETYSELFLCQEALDPGPGVSRAKPVSTCLSGLRVLTPQDCSPTFSSRGCCSLQSVLVARPPFPLLGQNKVWKPQIPSFKWLGRGIPSLTSPSHSAQLF